jgi:hypothetical protein
MSKKYSVIRDELNIKHPHGGIYCFLPFDYFDEYNKAIFKIGLTTRALEKRTDSYHTYFPMGVTLIANLENPLRGVKDKSNVEVRKKRYETIEKFLMKYIIGKGGYQIRSTTKSKDEGRTEWVYTDVATIKDAFEEALNEFGGSGAIFLFDDGYDDRNTKKLEDKYFIGKIIYPLIDPPWVTPKEKKKK